MSAAGITPPPGYDYNLYAARVMQDRSAEFRWLEYANGKKVLQVACQWTQGNTSGIEWRDIPVVKESTL